MHSKHTFKLLIAILFFAGCASDRPRSFVAGIDAQTRQSRVEDAQAQRVKGHPSIRFDAALLDTLDASLAEPDLKQARKLSDALLTNAHDLAMRCASNEMLRLSDEAWSSVVTDYFGLSMPIDAEIRGRLADEVRRGSDVEFWLLQQQIANAKDIASLRIILADLRKNTETSAKVAGRGGRQATGILFAPAAAAIRDSIHDDEATCQGDGRFAGVTRYVLSSDATDLSISNGDLLARYAPVFLQETLENPPYNASADRLGTVVASDRGDIDVDTTKPSIYGYTRTVLLSGEAHVQLTYVLWYPEHPALKFGIDAEAGHIDGATVRITFDSENKPALYETLNNCGCHHRLYPSEALEEAARKAFGETDKGKTYVIERDAEEYDVIIPGLLRTQDGDRAFVRCLAGTHAVVNVTFAAEKPNEPVVATEQYQLRNYDELERLATPGGRIVSMFEPNGLVRGAERFEGKIFNSLGMLSAGQPRQRGTQLIQWDAYDFDDPHLYEKIIRLPKHF